MDALSPSERRQFKETAGYIDIMGSLGGRYRLYIMGNIMRWDEVGRPAVDICAHLPYGRHSHPALNMLAVKLLIQTNEGQFLKLVYVRNEAYARVVYDEVLLPRREQRHPDVPF